MHEAYTPSFLDRLVVGALLGLFTLVRFGYDVASRYRRLAATLRVFLRRPSARVPRARDGSPLPTLRLVPREQSWMGSGAATRARRAGVDELVIDDYAAWSERLR